MCLRILMEQHFNSQPHKEADLPVRDIQFPSKAISTHSLTRRLTEEMFKYFDIFKISTHSLTRRLTHMA